MRASRCGAAFQLLLAGATVGRCALEASCQTRFFEAKCIFCWQGRVTRTLALRRGVRFLRKPRAKHVFLRPKCVFDGRAATR